MANRYWVGGAAAWDATAGTKWALISGGTGGEAVPTSADDVFFDAASGAVAVSVSTVRVCRSLNTTGFTGTIGGGSRIDIGDASGGALTVGATSGALTTPLQLQATTDNGGAGWPITTNGKTLPNVTFNGVGGKWQLQDALTCSGVFAHTTGHLDTNSQAVTINSYLNYGGGGTKTLTLGSSAVYIAGNTYLINATGSGLTVTPNTATFTMGPHAIIVRGNQDWGGASLDVTRNTDGTGQRGLELAGTWKNITVTTGVDTLNSLSSSFVAIGTLTLSGRNSTTSRMLVSSATLGTPLVITAAAVSLTDVDFMDISIVGPVGSTITSDSFNRADALLAGSTTDVAAGGTGKVWSNAGWSIASNVARPTAYDTNAKYAWVDTGYDSHYVATKVVTLPGASASMGVMLRGSSDTSVRVFVDSTGAAYIQASISGNLASYLSMSAGLFAAGDVIGAAVVGRAVTMFKNGVPVASVVIATLSTTGTWAGVYGGGVNGTTLDDFIVKELPNVTGTRLGDCLGNSGITFTTASGTARDGGGPGVKRYAVAAGNFSSTATWSESDGGAPGASVPLPQDDVYLTASSAAGTYTVDMPRTCRNLDCTGFTRTLGASVGFSVYGSWTSGSGMTYSGTGVSKSFRGRGSHTINTAGVRFGDNGNSTNIIAPGGTYTLTGPMTNAADVTFAGGSFGLYLLLVAGTFDTGNYDVLATAINVSGTLTKGFIFGTSTITARTNTTTFNFSAANTTISAAAATFVIATNTYFSSDTGFVGGGNTFGTLTYMGADSPYALTITGANTIGVLNIGSGRSLKLPSNTQTTVGTLNMAGVAYGYQYLPGLAGKYASSPDSAATSITGDLDIRVRAATTWTTTAILLGKYTTVGNQASYILTVENSGRPRLYLSTNGSTVLNVSSSIATSFVNGQAGWVRATYRQSDQRVQFFTAADSPTMPSSWTQLGTNQTITGITAIFDGTAPVEIGSYAGGTTVGMGAFYRAQIRSNILDDGTGIAFDADFATKPLGLNNFTESSANAALVTINGGTVANVGDGRVVIESSTAGTSATLNVSSAYQLEGVDIKDVTVNGDVTLGAQSVIRTNVRGVRRSPRPQGLLVGA